ncbi:MULTISPECIES: diguanylate cyclase [unclassified Novosphingobium]|uniref:GGDEF domain-containing protein n=1 Tax=unclassified Novosphingobium TaxID=2644732 RepID=UPI0025D6AC01|nr:MULTISPECIES: diguanylate cyclase [unclassified Novosphingobium]HQV03034.1 diguanylate cyclase [Novosphingobium sp.]
MTKVGAAIRGFLNPYVPEEIRDEFLLLSAGQLQEQSKLLFLAFLLTTPCAALAAAPDASLWVRFVVPAAMALFCLAGYLNLRRDLRLTVSPRRARAFLRQATVSSSLIATMCSAWCVYSWLGAPPDERIYYPMIIALGAFSTAYCVASARLGAILNLVINLVPMAALLFTSGQRMDLAVGVSLLVAALFQLHMIHKQQTNVIRLLSLQRQSRNLAITDPLTGLLNRRALLDTATELGAQGPIRLLLIDIDHFKAINDAHGHDQGDEVLREVATRLAIKADLLGSVARIGGEEFAIIGMAQDLPEALALVLLHDLRTAAMPHAAQVTISIGLADGPVADEPAWRELYRRADRALYEAKQTGRNRAVSFANLAEAPDDKVAAA